TASRATTSDSEVRSRLLLARETLARSTATVGGEDLSAGPRSAGSSVATSSLLPSALRRFPRARIAVRRAVVALPLPADGLAGLLSRALTSADTEVSSSSSSASTTIFLGAVLFAAFPAGLVVAITCFKGPGSPASSLSETTAATLTGLGFLFVFGAVSGA